MLERTGLAPRHAGIVMVALAALAVTPTPAFAANGACEGVAVEVTMALEQEYAALAAAAMSNGIRPGQVLIGAIMENGTWSAAYVSTPVADDGVMFFQAVNGKRRFRDVWGGSADPSKRPELVAWAEKLGAPANLARCFADLVIGE